MPRSRRRTRYAALLRGINVGRAKRVAMSDLRALVESLGFSEVKTLLNSGNVAFTGEAAEPDEVGEAIETALRERLALVSRVTVLTQQGLAAAVAENPFATVGAEPSRLLVAFLRDPAAGGQKLQALTARAWTPDAFALGSRAAYLWCVGGILESALAETVGKSLGDTVTTRNWATVLKLQALVEECAAPDRIPGRSRTST